MICMTFASVTRMCRFNTSFNFLMFQCSIDMRKPLAENILLIGGTSMALGMRARIQQELNFLVASPQYSEKLKVRTFKFHTPPAKENYTAWLGGKSRCHSFYLFLIIIFKQIIFKNLECQCKGCVLSCFLLHYRCYIWSNWHCQY